ncbi:MAG: hypothetical protein IT177_03730 [Acidobacteria bacterium]|nr:hypothetical protein [Acidobacteriota bacterium]
MSEHHGEKELAAFIRAGAARRHDQAFGDYFRGRNASCALGAAYEGMYRLPDNADGTRPTKDLDWFFDCLEGTIRRCPAEGCRKRLTLASILVHLNDDHRWTREQIAAWLEDEKANGRLPPRTPPAP